MISPLHYDPERMSRGGQLADLASLDVLYTVPETELGLLLQVCVFRALAPGTLLPVEGASARHCYFVIQGTLWMMLEDRKGHDVPLGMLGRGDCCGEGALFGFRSRPMTVRSETTCYLLQAPHRALLELFPRTPLLAAALRRSYRTRLVQTTLGRVPLLSQLSPTVRQSIAARLSELRVERGAEIICQGQPGDSLYMIELGQVKVEQNGGVIAQLSEGDFFGEMSLLQARPHNATVRAMTPVELLVLPGEDFDRLLYEQPELRQQVQEVVQARIQQAAAVRSNQEHSAEIEVIIQHGLMRGKQLLARRPSLCPPGCRICEESCSERFGQPRLHLNDVTFGEFDLPSACRECEFGAECVEACPEDAIVWDENSALFINNDRCTGCGACVSACPYDAIQLVSRDRPERGWARQAPDLLLTLWRRLWQQDDAKPLPLVADKCDLCHDFSDRACVSHCPTGSLQVIPIEDLFGRQPWYEPPLQPVETAE